MYSYFVFTSICLFYDRLRYCSTSTSVALFSDTTVTEVTVKEPSILICVIWYLLTANFRMKQAGVCLYPYSFDYILLIKCGSCQFLIT